MSTAGPNIRAVSDPEGAARLAAARLEDLVIEAIELRGCAHVALAGGETPRRTYELFAERIGAITGLEIWFGDERAVGPDDAQSNYAMFRQALGQNDVEASAIHRIEGERGPEDAAAEYDRLLRERLPAGDDGVPLLDVAFQGLGEDGHTASLFPGNPAVDADGVCAPVHDAPKPPPDRITLTVPMLATARRIVFLVTGEGKAKAVAAMLREPDPEVPASLLTGPKTELIADEAALAAARRGADEAT